MITNDERSMGYMDLTGIFPHCSASGHEYVLVRYNYYSNAILVEPLKNHQANTIADVSEKINQQFATARVQPDTYVLDNELSNTLNKSFKKYTVNYQLVPPHSYWANKAERMIQTFKDHFKDGLATVNPEFPISHWGLLLTQEFLTFNVLLYSQLNQKISAYTYNFGNYDFNTTPKESPGKKVVVYSKPDQCLTWGLNVKFSWYFGPSMKHYWCVQCYFPGINQVRNCDTVTFVPHKYPFP